MKSLPDGIGLPFIAPFAIWATLICGGPRLRLPFDNGLREHMAFMRRAYRGEFS